MRWMFVVLWLGLGLLGRGPASAQAQEVPVRIETDPALRGGVIYVQKGSGRWQQMGTVTGIPRADTIRLQNHERYTIKVERETFFHIFWGKLDYQPAWEVRDLYAEQDALIATVRADPTPTFNAAGVMLKLVLPGLLAIVGVTLFVVRRAYVRKREAELARLVAEESAHKTQQVAKEMLASRTTRVTLPANMLIASYRIVTLLGEGGMASVFKVEDQEGQIYAMKVPHLKDADEVSIKRFLREIQICIQFQHPCVVRTFDAGRYDPEDGGPEIPYLVMEYLEGWTIDHVLETEIREGQAPDLEFALYVVKNVARALAAAHDRGIIHRDVKPANIMLTSDNQIKVMDFGIARSMNAETLTTQSLALGTPAYVAPEQVFNPKMLDHRADLYALGVLLFELITHTLPFHDEDLQVLLMQKVAGQANTPRRWNPMVPASLELIFFRLVQPQPENRFQSAHELVVALEAVHLPTVAAPSLDRYHR